MRNDGVLQARTPRTGRSSGFFPNSLRAILRSASNLASTVRSVAGTVSTSEDERQREQVQWAGFDRLELGPTDFRHVLLLTYANGFQVWDVEDADHLRELVSKRDGFVAFLRVQPEPASRISEGGFKAARPLLLVVTSDATNCSSISVSGGLTNGYTGSVGSPQSTGGDQFVPTVVKFYSVRNHTYVHTLNFNNAIHDIRCSPRVVVVALPCQLFCFDAATLQKTLTVLTYPSRTPNLGYGAVAVGHRWLAYAANQPYISNTGRVSPQHLTPPVGSLSTSPANGNLVARCARESSKQIAAGIVTLGDMGCRTVSRYFSELLPDGSSARVLGSPNLKSNCNGLAIQPYEAEHAGIVTVYDFLNRAVVAQFRAHGSPLAALSFDPSGTLLVTASVHGCTINVFRIMPGSNGGGANSNASDSNANYVHLYKLSRGVTNAVIQDITFSEDSHWIVVSSSRGTSHVFAISPFGGPVGPYTHGAALVDKDAGAMASMMTVPWWSNMGPLKSSQQASLPPPPTVNLSVVGRIKKGNGGWRAAVSGGGAATIGKASSSSGGVAVVFHGGRGQNLEAESGQNSLKEQLLVLSPSGHLFRYALCPSVGMEGSFSNGIASEVVTGVHGDSRETFYLQVVVEPLQRWDVCRGPDWVEREEKLENVIASVPAQDEVSMARTPRYKKESIGHGFGNERIGKDDMLPEEMHQWFLSNAEVQMYHFRPPIWAKPQISFHVFTGALNNGTPEKADIGGETEIEKVQARVVEVKKRDLVPVYDRLKSFQCSGGSRDREPSLNYGLNSSSLPLQLLRDDGIQDRFIGSPIGVVQIQRSSSGSSCGSEGSLYTAANIGMNGFHYSYRDPMQDMVVANHCHDSSISFMHQTQQSQLLADKAKLQCVNLPGSDPNKVKNHQPADSVIGSPPMEIPKVKCPDVYGMSPTVGGIAGINSLPDMESAPERVMLTTGDNTNTNAENMALFAREECIDVGSSSQGYTARNATSNGSGSAAVFNHNSWDESAVEGTRLHSIQPELHDNSNQVTGMSPNGTLNHVGVQQDYDPAAEEVESVDANSKSEDFEGEQGEDAWEGAMFPFTEEC